MPVQDRFGTAAWSGRLRQRWGPDTCVPLRIAETCLPNSGCCRRWRPPTARAARRQPGPSPRRGRVGRPRQYRRVGDCPGGLARTAPGAASRGAGGHRGDRSLLRLGNIRDVTSLSATYVVARLIGLPAHGVVADGHQLFLELAAAHSAEPEFTELPVSPRVSCRHVISGVGGVRDLA